MVTLWNQDISRYTSKICPAFRVVHSPEYSLWNYGTELNSKLVPVRIVDHESRSVVIVKSLIDEDDELIKLPISRIRRRIEGV